jgi:hypothetical protein
MESPVGGYFAVKEKRQNWDLAADIRSGTNSPNPPMDRG